MSTAVADTQVSVAQAFDVSNGALSLPGKGERPASCGTWYPREFCDECGEPHFGESRCLNRSCPECYVLWSRDRAASITRRLAAARHVGLWNQTEERRCDVAEHVVDECEECGPRRCGDVGAHGHRVGECPRCEEYRCPDHDPEHMVEECSECGPVPVEPSGPGLDKRAVHGVVSAPEGAVTTFEEVDDGFRKVYEIAEEHGIRGGVVLFHPWRVKQKWKAKWGEETNGGRDGPKLWAWVREYEGDWRQLVEWSPHWHILGLSDDIEPGKDRADGWVVKNVRAESEGEGSALTPFYLDGESEPWDGAAREGYEDMVRTARYLLSHVGFDPEKSVDSIRWYGELHSINFNPDPTRDDRELESPLSTVEWEAIEDMVLRVTGREAPGEEGEGRPGFECENCGSSSSSSIFRAGGALMDQGWCDRIGREQQRKLEAAFEWAIGDRLPPPGLKNPQSEEAAREAFAELL